MDQDDIIRVADDLENIANSDSTAERPGGDSDPSQAKDLA